MKKNIFTGIAVLAIATMAAFNLNLSSDKNTLSSLTLANVEALAGETPPNVITCYNAVRLTPKKQNEPVWVVTICNGCELVDCYEYKDSGTCTKNSGGIWV